MEEIIPEEQIKICLEQKSVLLTKVLDLTKQIQVRSRQPEIELDNFLELRGAYMERVEKCNHLAVSLTSQMPPVQQERMKRVLNADVTEEDCSEEELVLLLYAKKNDELLQRAAALNKSAYDAINKEYNSVREKLIALRKEGKKPTTLLNLR